MQRCVHMAIQWPFTQFIVWKYILQHSIRLHVCMYVRSVATRDKYTCTEPTGSSPDCARGGRIKSVIFHVYIRPTWVYLTGRFYEDKCYIVPCLSLYVCTLYVLYACTHFCLSASVFLNCSLFICRQWHLCGSSRFPSPKLLSTILIILFSSHLSEQISPPMKSDSTTFVLHFHL